MRLQTSVPVAVFVLFLAGCNRTKPAPAAQATLTLTDGSTFTGTVTNSSTSAISLQAPTGESRTYPMTQVASVQYAAPPDPTAAAPAPGTGQTPAGPASAANGPAAPAQAQPIPAPPPQTVEDVRTIPAGTTLQVRNNEAIDSQTAQPGQTFSAVVSRDVPDTTGNVAIPRGSSATLVVHAASDQGKLQGQSDLVVDVGGVTVNGRQYGLETSDYARRGKPGVGENRRTGIFAGGGAAFGGIIGALAGGGKGAAIGALSGAGAGTAAAGLTRGRPVRIAPETLLSFRLEAPVTIRLIQ